MNNKNDLVRVYKNIFLCLTDEVEQSRVFLHTFYQNIYAQYKTQQTKGGEEEEEGEDKTTATVQIGNSSFSLNDDNNDIHI